MSGPGEDEPWRLAKVVKGENVKWGSGNRRSPSLSPSAKARLARIVARTPEVTVKLTGRSRSRDGLKKHLDYITRHGQLKAVTQNGQTITSRAQLRGLHDTWIAENELDQPWRATTKGTPTSAQSVNLVLSMPPGTNREKLEVAAHAWATDTFKNTHDWVMVRHDDTKHPHCHITVRAVGYDGKRLAPGPAVLQSWRGDFAAQLRRQGVPAEATPRQARGVTRRPLGLAAQKIETKRQAAPAIGRNGPPPKPTFRRSAATIEKWTATIDARGRNIEQAYLTHAAALAHGDASDQQLARDIERFVAGMPVATGRRQAVRDELKAVTKAHPGSEQTPSTKIDNRPPAPAKQLKQTPATPTPPRSRGPRR